MFEHRLREPRDETRRDTTGCDGLGVAPAHTGHHHKTRQILGFASQSIINPRAHGGTSADCSARVHESMSGIVVDLLGDHRANDRYIIRHFCSPWEVVTDVLSTLTVLLEFGQVTLHLEFFTLQLSDGLPLGEGLGHWLPVEFIKFGFVVEGFELGWGADK